MSSEKKLADISTKFSSHHQAESEKTANKCCYYSHTLLRIHIIGGQRSVKISPPSLLHHSGSATRDFQSSISVEVPSVGIIWMGRAFINSSCPLPWPNTVVSSMAGEPWQRTGAVCEGRPAHPDDTHRGAF